MKWLVTYVPVSRKTRRRGGKSRTSVYHTHSDIPSSAEQLFETQHGRENSTDCKIVDIRPTQHASVEG